MTNRTSRFTSRAEREAREAAARAAAARAATAGADPATTNARRRRRRLRALAAVVVLIVAVVAVVGAVAFGGLGGPHPPPRSAPASPGTTTSAGIHVPLTGTPTNLAFQRTLGRPDAPVHLVLWSDFQCPACRDVAENTLPRLIADYVVPGRLRIEWQDLAVVGPESPAAAAAARCANDQNMFWPYHDVLFANQGPQNTGVVTPLRLKDMADAIGLDRTAFDACLPSQTVFNDVIKETNLGKKLSPSVPLLVVNGVVLVGSPAYDELRQTIDHLLAGASARPAPSGS